VLIEQISSQKKRLLMAAVVNAGCAPVTFVS